jgi:hypothetical protein
MATETKEAFFKRLDQLGVAMVRTNQATNVYLNYPEKVWVLEWLERSEEATSAEQLALARRAVEQATRAADEASAATKIAIAAKTIAIASMIITIIGIAIGVIVQHFWH